MKHIEDSLQMACVRWFDLQYPHLQLRLLHVPNGGKRSIREAARLKLMGVRAGFPDLLLLVPRGGSPFLGIELKTRTGRQSEHQRLYEEEFGRIGAVYVVCRSLEEFIRIVNGYLRL